MTTGSFLFSATFWWSLFPSLYICLIFQRLLLLLLLLWWIMLLLTHFCQCSRFISLKIIRKCWIFDNFNGRSSFLLSKKCCLLMFIVNLLAVDYSLIFCSTIFTIEKSFHPRKTFVSSANIQNMKLERR